MKTTYTTESVVLAEQEINHTTDGPVTEFVAISRAIELAETKMFPASDLANALSNVLDQIRSNGVIQSTEY